ncbi:MAG: hypothetical protein WCG59_03475 [Actinomycetes bacterium]|jgi:hypothetical protein
MGILDALRGTTKQVQPKLDALFAMPSAAVTLELQAGLVTSGEAGVCWKPPSGQAPADVQAEVTTLLDMGDDDPNSPSLRSVEDDLGFRWLIVEGANLDDLVTHVHQVNTLLCEHGWGPQLLCSVFGFVPAEGADQSATKSYLIYLYKRGTFYPFCPTGESKRDNEAELRLKATIGSDLPMESDLSRWMALWGLPVT